MFVVARDGRMKVVVSVILFHKLHTLIDLALSATTANWEHWPTVGIHRAVELVQDSLYKIERRLDLYQANLCCRVCM